MLALIHVDCAGLPQTYIDTGELDIFRDEDMDYARKLLAAGIHVGFHLYPSVPHVLISAGTVVARPIACYPLCDPHLSRALHAAGSSAPVPPRLPGAHPCADQA